jgi:hypothetical protein
MWYYYIRTEDKSDDTKNKFYEVLENIFDEYPKYRMNILFKDINAKLGTNNIFKLTIGNESLYDTNNYNGIREVNYATSKDLIALTSQ